MTDYRKISLSFPKPETKASLPGSDNGAFGTQTFHWDDPATNKQVHESAGLQMVTTPSLLWMSGLVLTLTLYTKSLRFRLGLSMEQEEKQKQEKQGNIALNSSRLKNSLIKCPCPYFAPTDLRIMVTLR